MIIQQIANQNQPILLFFCKFYVVACHFIDSNNCDMCFAKGTPFAKGLDKLKEMTAFYVLIALQKVVVNGGLGKLF